MMPNKSLWRWGYLYENSTGKFNDAFRYAKAAIDQVIIGCPITTIAFGGKMKGEWRPNLSSHHIINGPGR